MTASGSLCDFEFTMFTYSGKSGVSRCTAPLGHAGNHRVLIATDAPPSASGSRIAKGVGVGGNPEAALWPAGSRIAEIAARHRRIEGVDICAYCDLLWPCDASILAALLTPERLARAIHATEGYTADTFDNSDCGDIGYATTILAALGEQG